MTKTIAIEEGLTGLTHDLTREGYRVVRLQEGQVKDADAVIITGLDQNFMGQHDRKTGGIVINAQGRSSADILNELRDRLPARLG
ncbi:MAG: YkuS family protein [Actinobacteria bacterium]|nr:YkuS family protein [Actinomycetota bacterium]